MPRPGLCSSSRAQEPYTRVTDAVTSLINFWPWFSLNILPGPLTACVAGLSNPSLATCNSTGDRDNVTDPNYTCNQGYYKVPAPTFCEGTLTFRGRAIVAPALYEYLLHRLRAR
jgi:hypothetical protein